MKEGPNSQIQPNVKAYGWQSTTSGLEPTYLSDHGHEVLNPGLPDGDFDAAVRTTQIPPIKADKQARLRNSVQPT